MHEKNSFLTNIVAGFLKGNLPALLIIVSLVAGAIALSVTPREEEPQIVVPIADVMIAYPGGSAEEVEKLVASRLERLLYQIDGVEYVYSTSQSDMALVTVRFFVGENREDSLIKLYNKLQQSADQVTPGITGWLVKPIEIDDVPIVSATLYSDTAPPGQLYRVAEELVGKLQHIEDTGRITIHGGQRRIALVTLKPERLAAYHISPTEIVGALQLSNAAMASGEATAGEAIAIRAGPFLSDMAELGGVMIGVHADKPIYLSDVATVEDRAEEATSYSRFYVGPADPTFAELGNTEHHAVTVGVCKKKGSNAVKVAQAVEQTLSEMQPILFPDNIEARITRDYGATANDKVNNLVGSLALAVLTVIGLLALTMSWREGTIVALAVPITYSLTLLANYLLGYTINRVTLFALILALGLLVDDPIASVENIERHLRLNPGKNRLRTIIGAMDEIMPPVLLSTLAIILAFLPMFFISGMMGPYMRPMAINVPIAVTMSTVVALTITPWLCSKLLRHAPAEPHDLATSLPQPDIKSSGIYRFYDRLIGPILDSRAKRIATLGIIAGLFAFSIGLAAVGLVPLKMLPFDNKNEFQLIVDMPEGTTLEQTDRAVRQLEEFVRSIPEVTDLTSTIGTSSPMDFNGMVRHYYLREGANIADIRVNITHRTKRKTDSHALVLRIRNDIAALGEQIGGSVKIVEVPPGPPVLATLVAEIYGGDEHAYADLVAAAQTVKQAMGNEPGVVDLDDTPVAPQRLLDFVVDRAKASRNGIAVKDVAETLRLGVGGMQAGILHMPREQNELPIILRLSRADRSQIEALKALPIKGRGGQMVQLGELGSFNERTIEQPIFHKNQERVVYVTSEVAGIGPAYSVLNLQKHFKQHPLPDGIRLDWRGEGEWKITLDVFRDLGIAFSIALLGIYVLLVYETGSYLLPLIIMLAIPLTAIGIMPGFWLINLVSDRPVGGFDNPVFFTATAMIGMIALCGIVVRNAIVLIDFIRQTRATGTPLRDAIIEAGAVRLRPIVLTAGTTLLGTWPITFDPIFSGLAWSIIFGLLVSTVFTLVVVPVVYLMIYGEGEGEGELENLKVGKA
jgi:multidrug efflux pump subunit AcrB